MAKRKTAAKPITVSRISALKEQVILRCQRWREHAEKLSIEAVRHPDDEERLIEARLAIAKSDELLDAELDIIAAIERILE